MNFLLSNLTNLQQRIIAAIVGVSIILTATLYSEWSFILLFTAISTLTQLEFYKLLGLDGNQPLKTYGTLCGIGLNLLTFTIEKGYLNHAHYFLICPLVSMIFFIKLYKRDDLKPFTNIGFTFLGLIYVALPFSLLSVMALRSYDYNPEVILGSLFLLWATDVGAYIAGTLYGKRKLFERVSPKKSWEGAAGGAISALLVALALGYFFHTVAPWQWYCIAIIITVSGTYGDLVESLFKRSIAIKDSGNSIPGHGGFLDRFDGLLLSAPFTVTFLELFG